MNNLLLNDIYVKRTEVVIDVDGLFSVELTKFFIYTKQITYISDVMRLLALLSQTFSHCVFRTFFQKKQVHAYEHYEEE